MMAQRNPIKTLHGRLDALQARAISMVAQCSIYELTAPGVIPSEGHNPQAISLARSLPALSLARARTLSLK